MAANPPNPSINCAPSSVSIEIKEIKELLFAAITDSSSINEIFSISVISSDLALHDGQSGISSEREIDTFH